jgi:hypothetical protein
MPKQVDRLPASLVLSAKEWGGHLWAADDRFHLECNYRVLQLGPCDFLFTPIIYASQITDEMLRSRFLAFGAAMQEALSSKTHVATSAEVPSELGQQMSDRDTENLADSTYENSLLQLLQKENLLSRIETVLNEEVASLVLIDRMLASFHLLSNIKNASYVLLNVQKKWNVFYTRADWRFHGGCK